VANNRLYIVDTVTGKYFLLAKSMGDGWYIRDDLDEPDFAERFEAWADGLDAAAYGNPRDCRTSLKLMCENDPDWAPGRNG
jgi:hypothetical protein